ncbi:hypothetical protein AGABI1DRAFT_92101 [Agaricus bisporus var. burnettii JB137-S8]|uniref:Uncharacterized protein n=1 Tax=Agaricus bisporus var. burnettii (strain JB137-S8 / ATCC MYA-4627 / FGSC 10392) TaxID=597362 RepID=K5VYS0_AGABU|nr:uncharacterized protein AGABI1DRAFT_92101 [Agaricus bisporus var. burnettii JB137-S8]EKM79614.1 hypothetical protein AGABI1DRAFT_92101 [Agaricus bisporus var. burnettii JB137-S8]
MNCLEDVAYMNYDIAGKFLTFMEALHLRRNNSVAYYNKFLSCAHYAVKETITAQEVLLKFRDDIRIVVDKITTLISGNSKDVSLFTSESSQSMLELATAVEECIAILEGHRKELKNVQRQKLDENDDHPSEAEFQMLQEKWLTFRKSAGAGEYQWHALQREIRGSKDSDEPAMTSMSPAMPIYSSKNHSVPFWQKFFRRIWS